MTDQWTDRLSAYLDGEFDPEARREVERHLAECPECAAVLTDLRRIVAAAPGYQGTAPSSDLWQGIAARIDRGKVVPLGRWRMPWRSLLAAGLLLGVGAGSAWWWLEGRPGARQTIAKAPALVSAAPVALTSSGYDAAIAELEATLRANRNRLDSATVRVLEQSLRSIDQAIAEARSAIQRDTANGYLNGQIAANMRKKLNVLRFATRAIASET
jgi:anti-sigma factor RsiW